jgi:formate hydrogenlyase subunit 6/NADH:ubiquinone oxidoreductase subunit I
METPCVVCQEVCPVSPKAIETYDEVITRVDGVKVTLNKPFIIPERCIGCGICEKECPVLDERAVYVTAVGETRFRNHSDRRLLLNDKDKNAALYLKDGEEKVELHPSLLSGAALLAKPQTSQKTEAKKSCSSGGCSSGSCGTSAKNTNIQVKLNQTPKLLHNDQAVNLPKRKSLSQMIINLGAAIQSGGCGGGCGCSSKTTNSCGTSGSCGTKKVEIPKALPVPIVPTNFSQSKEKSAKLENLSIQKSLSPHQDFDLVAWVEDLNKKSGH